MVIRLWNFCEDCGVMFFIPHSEAVALGGNRKTSQPEAVARRRYEYLIQSRVFIIIIIIIITWSTGELGIESSCSNGTMENLR